MDKASIVYWCFFLYSFNGSVRLQLEGGPIGNQLSGALAKVYMLRAIQIKIDSYNKQLLVDSFNISHWNQIRNSITSFASP